MTTQSYVFTKDGKFCGLPVHNAMTTIRYHKYALESINTVSPATVMWVVSIPKKDARIHLIVRDGKVCEFRYYGLGSAETVLESFSGKAFGFKPWDQ